ncbi:MAG: type III pantothenate kinase [Gammaproteobacteria bacterium]|nr:type III pantothenate kinase [Gammaproteobacteria bacterium]
MTVLVDAGNSRFKWCELCGGELGEVYASAYASPDRAQAVQTALNTAHAPRRTVIASVLGDSFRYEFTRLVAARYRHQPEFVISERSSYGIRLAYDNPKTFGADRFCALVAVRRRYHEPCIVVDCGTAVTIDALDAQGQHLGGLILPGVELMRRSLIEHTARISFDSNGDSDDQALFGRSTAQGVKAGARLALTASIDRIVADMGAHIIRLHGNVPVHTIMTGGAGMHMLGYLAARYEFEPKLVLQGLAIIADDSAMQASSRERES